MGYFKNIFDMLLLKDEAYKEVGNDKHSFKKLALAWFISSYLVMFFLGVLIFAGISLLSPQILSKALQPIIILHLAFLFLILPFITLLVGLIFTLIPHLIGLAFGGKPRGYLDFFTVGNYTCPVIYPVTLLFNKILGPIYTIWSFFILYKTYKNIHRLSPGRAGGALAVNILLYLGFVAILIVLFIALMKDNPVLFAAMTKHY